jgi:hypothetical protein
MKSLAGVWYMAVQPWTSHHTSIHMDRSITTRVARVRSIALAKYLATIYWKLRQRALRECVHRGVTYCVRNIFRGLMTTASRKCTKFLEKKTESLRLNKLTCELFDIRPHVLHPDAAHIVMTMLAAEEANNEFSRRPPNYRHYSP